MLITSAALTALRVGFSAKFQGAFDNVESQRDRIAEVMPSTTGENLYGWLGELPGMVEWVGERVVHGLKEHDYRIVNKDFELTVSVPRNHIKDDTLSTYGKRFEIMGRSTARQPEQLVWNTLKAGFDSPCYDGQNFFDEDHPVLDEDGEMTTVSNTQGGSGAPWFLMCTKEIVKPIIFQDREKATFTALDKPDDPNVFHNKEYIYGSEARNAAGYGFWQMAVGSKQPLTPENYAAARETILSMKADHGAPMGLTPDLLVVGPTQEGAAKKILNNERAPNGETNEWKGTAEMLMTAYLA